MQRLELGETTDRDLDGREEVGALERLDEVGEGPGISGALDEVALAERREDQDRRQALARDLARRGQAVEAGHLDVEDGDIGLEAPHQLDGFVAAAGLGDDLVPLFLEGFLEVEADDGLVLSDHDTGGHRCAPV